MKNLVKESLFAMAIFILLSAIFFWPYLEGKRVYQGDMVQFMGMAQEIKEVDAQIGRKPLWTNSMFGGMPTYQISTPHKGNYLRELDHWWQLGNLNPIGMLFASMTGCFLLLLLLRVDYRLAIIGGIAFGLATNNIILYEAGHLSKLRALSYLPVVVAGTVLAYRGRYWWGFFLFSMGAGLHLMANHVQMTYYFLLTMPILLGGVLIKALRDKALTHFLKASTVLLVGLFLALGSAVGNLWSTYEYSKETIRGDAIISTAGDELVDSTLLTPTSSGLGWEYSMQWSNGLIDLMACIIPGIAGSSSQETLFKESKLYQELQGQGISDPGKLQAPLYWGPLPFTSGPSYVGIVLFFLFMLGLILVKGPVKWWVAIGSLVMILLSMGKNLTFFNALVYEYLPMYNKFRAPNSILSLLPLMITPIAILSLQKIISPERKEDLWPFIKKIAIRLLSLTLGIAILGPYLFSFSSPNDSQYALSGLNIDHVMADRKYLLRYDALRAFFLIGVLVTLLWAFIHQRIKMPVFILGIGLLVVIDFWTINRRFINADNFQEARKYERIFNPRPVDEQILNDPDPNFRVLDWTVNTFNSSTTSYFHKSLGGYHAAKLRRYQDVIDQYLVRGDRGVINMLNAKYVIQQGADGNPSVWSNQEALGNAWPVDSIHFVKTANDELGSLDQIDAAKIAVVHEEFRPYLLDLDSDTSAKIQLVNYIPDYLTYTTSSNGEMLAVFSEIWYGPDKGWEVYIDGNPTEHIRVNYLLRGLRVPSGEHTIEFIFQPKSFYHGRTISRISSALILYGFIWFIGMTVFTQTVSAKKLKTKKSKELDPLLDDLTVSREEVTKDPGQEVGRPDWEVAPNVEGMIPSTGGYPDFRLLTGHRFLPQIFYLLSGIVLVLTLTMSLSTGLNADEEYQVDYATKLVNFYTSLGKDTSALFIEKGNIHLYGGFFDLTTGMINRLLGLNEFDAGYHRVRHLFVALLGFLTIMFASLLAKIIGGWRAAILTMLFLFLSPRFLGHSLMNPKDIPFAAGYMGAIYFMVRFYVNFPKVRGTDIAGMIIGIGVALGTRAGGLLVIAFILFFAAIDFLRKHPLKSWKFQHAWIYLKYLIIITGAGYLLAILFWPAALVDPLHHPLHALRRFEDLNVYIRLLFKGENVMSDQVSRDYLLIWIWKTIPLFSLGGIIGSIFLLKTAMRKYPKFPLIVLFVTAFFPVLYIILQKSVLHDGWRHLIFIYPPAVILAALFWIGLEHRFKESKAILFSLYGLLGLALLESGIFIVKNADYPYVYFNPIAGGMQKAYGYFETDYWGTSVKQAINWMEDEKILRADMQDTITVATSFYYNVTRQLKEEHRKWVKVKYVRYNERYQEKWDYAIFPSRFVPANQIRSGLWPPEETIHSIRAGRVPLVAILHNRQESVQKGMEALKNEDWQSANDLLETSISSSPGNAALLKGLATAKLKLGLYPEAINLHDRLISVEGHSSESYDFLAEVYLASKDIEKAKQACYQAIEINRDFYPAYYHLALVYDQENNELGALENAQKSIKIEPKFADAYKLIADIYERQGASERAAYFRSEYQRLTDGNQGE